MLYKALIQKIENDFLESGHLDLEDFLKKTEQRYKTDFALGDLLFYVNINEILERAHIKSDYFQNQLRRAHDEDRT